MYVSSLPAQVTTSICGWRVERAQKNSRNAKSLSGNCVKMPLIQVQFKNNPNTETWGSSDGSSIRNHSGNRMNCFYICI